MVALLKRGNATLKISQRGRGIFAIVDPLKMLFYIFALQKDQGKIFPSSKADIDQLQLFANIFSLIC